MGGACLMGGERGRRAVHACVVGAGLEVCVHQPSYPHAPMPSTLNPHALDPHAPMPSTLNPHALDPHTLIPSTLIPSALISSYPHVSTLMPSALMPSYPLPVYGFPAWWFLNSKQIHRKGVFAPPVTVS